MAMRRLGIRLLVTLAVAFATAVATQPETDPFSDWVISGDYAYGLVRAEAASTNGAEDVVWTGDGTALVVVRTERVQDAQLPEPVAPRATVVAVWSRSTGKIRDLLRFSQERRISVFPLGSTSSVIVHADDQHFLLDTGSGKSGALSVPEGALPDFYPEVAPSGKRFAVRFTLMESPVAGRNGGASAPPQVRSSIRMYDLAGSMVAAAEIPRGYRGLRWTPDGSVVVYTGRTPAPQLELVLGSSGFVPYEGSLAQEPQEGPEPPVVFKGGRLGNGNSVDILEMLALEKSDMERALVSGDREGEWTFSPKFDAIAYISHGVPMVRRIIKMPKDQFLVMVKEAKKRRTMSNAKQVALAIMMYSMDSDDAFPLITNFADGVMPYLKNAALTNGFVYTYSGGPLAKDADPAKTEIGYMPGEGGRAVTYGDGSVRWFPDP